LQLGAASKTELALFSHISKDLTQDNRQNTAPRKGNATYITDRQVFYTGAGDLISLLSIGVAAE
jgi:hypothetical protein